jgi:hypothetical protein
MPSPLAELNLVTGWPPYRRTSECMPESRRSAPDCLESVRLAFDTETTLALALDAPIGRPERAVVDPQCERMSCDLGFRMGVVRPVGWLSVDGGLTPL